MAPLTHALRIDALNVLKARAGCQNAQTILYNSLKLDRLLTQYSGFFGDRDDAQSIAYQGFCNALNSYTLCPKHDTDGRFATYAFSIIQNCFKNAASSKQFAGKKFEDSTHDVAEVIEFIQSNNVATKDDIDLAVAISTFPELECQFVKLKLDGMPQRKIMQTIWPNLSATERKKLYQLTESSVRDKLTALQ